MSPLTASPHLGSVTTLLLFDCRCLGINHGWGDNPVFSVPWPLSVPEVPGKLTVFTGGARSTVATACLAATLAPMTVVSTYALILTESLVSPSRPVPSFSPRVTHNSTYNFITVAIAYHTQFPRMVPPESEDDVDGVRGCCCCCCCCLSLRMV